MHQLTLHWAGSQAKPSQASIRTDKAEPMKCLSVNRNYSSFIIFLVAVATIFILTLYKTLQPWVNRLSILDCGPISIFSDLLASRYRPGVWANTKPSYASVYTGTRGLFQSNMDFFLLLKEDLSKWLLEKKSFYKKRQEKKISFAAKLYTTYYNILF